MRAARHRLVTVMAGAPGTGKSHTLVSLVCDALPREESVLLAARGEAAVDALVDLMARQPGVPPVVFGSSERRAKLAQRLADGELQPVDETTLEAAAAALSTAIARRDAVAEQAAESLRAEWRLSADGQDALDAVRRIAPAALAGDAAELGALVSRCSDAATGWRARPEDRSQLDVRRNSLFDAAAAVVPAIALDEHFRSAPHLIEVVAERIYDGRLRVATRTPVSETIDCVDLRITNGQRRDGTVPAEIDMILDLLRRNAAAWRSVGVMTPFRAQADAIERAVLASFGAAELVTMNLRVGTVHGFQGNERDVVICSLGLVDDDTAGWAFVDDPHLLAVMLTRVRNAMVLVTSCHPDPASVLGSYIAAADSPPGPPPPAAALSDWAASIAADLRLAGVTVETAYPTGRHILDIATIRHRRPVAIVCDLHPDGIAAHLDRHLALRTQGWTVINALRTEWDEDAAASSSWRAG
ncbi:MAG: DEAD/DEAH box helicase [Ilumatobacteraceae bacterium]